MSSILMGGDQLQDTKLASNSISNKQCYWLKSGRLAEQQLHTSDTEEISQSDYTGG
jgi:hypothetical protein